jgi:hypothetical protein
MYPTSKNHIAAITAAAALLLLALEMPAQQPTAGAASATANDAQAQSDQRQQQQHRLALLAQYLNLTADQKRQWMKIQREAAQNVRVARKDDSLSEEQMQQKIKEIHAEQRRQILALLTAEQQEALKKWWEEQRRAQGKGTEGAGGPGASSPGGSADDDFFAGMVQDNADPDPAPGATAAQSKAAPPKR